MCSLSSTEKEKILAPVNTDESREYFFTGLSMVRDLSAFRVRDLSGYVAEGLSGFISSIKRRRS